jgi:hypothetical protein
MIGIAKSPLVSREFVYHSRLVSRGLRLRALLMPAAIRSDADAREAGLA